MRSRTTSTGRELQISGLATGKLWWIGALLDGESLGTLPLSASRSQPAPLSLLQPISSLARWPGGCGCHCGGARCGPQACPKEEFAALRHSQPTFGLTQMLWRRGSLLAKRPGEKCAALRLSQPISGLAQRRWQSLAEGALLFMEFASLRLW